MTPDDHARLYALAMTARSAPWEYQPVMIDALLEVFPKETVDFLERVDALAKRSGRVYLLSFRPCGLSDYLATGRPEEVFHIADAGAWLGGRVDPYGFAEIDRVVTLIEERWWGEPFLPLAIGRSR